MTKEGYFCFFSSFFAFIILTWSYGLSFLNPTPSPFHRWYIIALSLGLCHVTLQKRKEERIIGPKIFQFRNPGLKKKTRFEFKSWIKRKQFGSSPVIKQTSVLKLRLQIDFFVINIIHQSCRKFFFSIVVCHSCW
jgi:hypothetical protein